MNNVLRTTVANSLKLTYSLIIASALINNAFADPEEATRFDEYGRLVEYPNKIEVTCPIQNEKTAVLFVIGQSNAANNAEKKFSTYYPTRVVNYFNGKCFVASSPFLGATGDEGEFITPLADQLINSGYYEFVVIIDAAIGGSTIKRWLPGMELNKMMLSVMADVALNYKITAVIWHQGEADFQERVESDVYRKRFHSLVESIRSNTSYDLPVYYAIATKCGEHNGWTEDNTVADAQRSLTNAKNHIYLGANTDHLLLKQDRRSDQCHLSRAGQLKAANAFANAILEHMNLHSLKTKS